MALALYSLFKGDFMSYLEWFEAHARKHEAIMQTLTHLNDNEVIDYFNYENMQKNHPDFCPLYEQNKKCHEMTELNCYFCACMHFRFSDQGLAKEGEHTRYSLCSIHAKESKDFVAQKAIHLDCSNCYIPHKKSVIQKYFSRSWREIMAKTVSN